MAGSTSSSWTAAHADPACRETRAAPRLFRSRGNSHLRGRDSSLGDRALARFGMGRVPPTTMPTAMWTFTSPTTDRTPSTVIRVTARFADVTAACPRRRVAMERKLRLRRPGRRRRSRSLLVDNYVDADRRAGARSAAATSAPSLLLPPAELSAAAEHAVSQRRRQRFTGDQRSRLASRPPQQRSRRRGDRLRRRPAAGRVGRQRQQHTELPVPPCTASCSSARRR